MARLNTQPMIAGTAVGAVAAIALVLLPGTALESIIARTHLADVMTAAQPPLGTKARILIALIPFVILTAIGVTLGFLMGGRKRKDDYGDYGAYADYGAADLPEHADPFATSDVPIMAGTYEAEPVEAPIEAAPEPELAPPPPAPAPLPVAAPMAQAAPLDGATAGDLAEIADAVVRLDARLDSIEAKLGSTAPTSTAADLSKRLAKIAKSLDEAG